VALVFGVPGAALAKKKPQKRTVSATVGGKHVTWTGRFVQIHDDGGILTVIATKSFGTKTIGLGCALTPTPLGCNMNYTVRKGRRYQGWINPGGDPTNLVVVTIDSFDGSVIQGSFSCTMQSTTFGGPALAVQGTFRGPLGP
jgi:hypothetical protein